MKKLFKQIEKTRISVAKAQSECDCLWLTFIQYISDYNEISYDNWTIIDSIDGLVFSDGEILTASVTEVLKLIEKNGSVNKYDIYSCRI